MTEAECSTALRLHPQLAAVVADDPVALLRAANGAAASGEACRTACGLTACHLAAALDRRRCLVALLDAGASPCVWTRPPCETGSGDEEGYASYDQVTESDVYRLLKNLLPTQAAFPATFTLAQLLLKAPCCPLALAVRFGHNGAARTLLAAVRASGSGDAQRQLEDALAWWASGSELQLQVGLLRHLLAAGTHPIRSLLPSLLCDYEGCQHTSGLAEKLRSGLREVLEHSLPTDSSSSGTSSTSGSPTTTSIAAAANSGPATSALTGPEPAPAAPAPAAAADAPGGGQLLVHVRRHVFAADEARLLLAAAVACRDEQRCCHLLGGLIVAQARGNPWGLDPEDNCSLLVAAAAHDMPAVVHALLAVPPAVEGGQPPFSPNSWGIGGLSALMAAAYRGALGALGALLDCGATTNLADEMGATALHWAVVGGHKEAVLALVQRGAAVDATGVVHEEEEHLERPLLTAAHRGDLDMMRLLIQLGASLDAPSPCGYTPLSVAISWEQREAAHLLLQLGADPNQLLEPHVNGGYYPVFSEISEAEEVGSLLTIALSRVDYRGFVTALLEAGADPTLRHPVSGLTPAAEAASLGLVTEAALLFELTAEPAGPWTLDQLGWSEAMVEVLRGDCLLNFSEGYHPLMEVWSSQPAPVPEAPPPAACHAIVEALLANYGLKPQQSTGKLVPGAELAAVRAAETLATIGICADLTSRLQGSTCKLVILAAAPAASRWSPARHPHFPPAFKRTVRALLLTNHRLAMQHAELEEIAAWIASPHGRLSNGEPCPCFGCSIACPQQRADYQQFRAQRMQIEQDRLAQTGAGLPTDALMEVFRCLAAKPLSSWMSRACR